MNAGQNGKDPQRLAAVRDCKGLGRPCWSLRFLRSLLFKRVVPAQSLFVKAERLDKPMNIRVLERGVESGADPNPEG